jgi:hypothetical protein
VTIPASLPIRQRNAALSSDAPKAGWRVRVRVCLAWRTLDNQIAEGCDIDDSPVLALRAEQLSGASERLAVAACFANILDAAEERQADPGSHLSLDHAAVIASRAEILALIEVLRSESVVDPRGVALAVLLIERRTSPLFKACAGRTLEQAIAEIADAL